MRLAFAAAESIGGFTLFPSFDMAVGEWGVQTVIDIINEFKSSSAHATKNGSPLISTFEGPGWSGNWATVRSGTGGIYLVPDWSSLGPDGVAGKLDQIDGHCT
jgi:glucan endo-1,3-alpha-glucosidase